jgi:glycyl-tRNA synthetase
VPAPDLDTLVSLAKRRGFVFPSSDIYGGFASTWDYGPLGAELVRNIKDAWWRDVVHARDDVVGLNASILMHPRIWEASGHLENFNDPLVECASCQRRYRQDDVPDNLCPHDGTELSEARQFNTMFKTFVGPLEDDAGVAYLRPETAQAIFVNFKNVVDSSRVRLPFGVAQIGKAFRNEITTGSFIFRSREFEQMELEYFVRSGDEDQAHAEWLEARFAWWQAYGLNAARLRLRPHGAEELSHYSKATTDIEYEFPFGWGELEGVASRTDFDLVRHSEASGERLQIFDEDTKEHVMPFVIEPSAGVDRGVLAFLSEAYTAQEVRGDTRIFLNLHPRLAPLKAAVYPLARNKPPLVELARSIHADLKTEWPVFYDATGSIGRRYARQDEAGTPFGITVDYESLENQTVTVRHRDTMEQERVNVDVLRAYLRERLS